VLEKIDAALQRHPTSDMESIGESQVTIGDLQAGADQEPECGLQGICKALRNPVKQGCGLKFRSQIPMLPELQYSKSSLLGQAMKTASCSCRVRLQVGKSFRGEPRGQV
jgi:hypothetical protein